MAGPAPIPSPDPFAVWHEHFEYVQRQVQEAAEKWRQSATGGGHGSAAFAAPLGEFLDTYKRSLQGFTGRLLEDEDPLLAGLRHVFAGAHDAVGWGVYTRLAEASGELAKAQLAARDAQAKAWQQITAAWETARKRFGDELSAMTGRKESFADVQRFLRAWTRVLDAAAQEAMQSEIGLVVTAEANRAAARLRLAHNRVVELWSELYNVPTRAELDEAYRLIHELRRELRAMKKERQ
ncbi:MAG: poly(R)-hydroxyalkanoic acid synthase subunit PhaE [Burkholderiales bacterium]